MSRSLTRDERRKTMALARSAADHGNRERARYLFSLVGISYVAAHDLAMAGGN